MKAFFSSNDPTGILNKMNSLLSGRELGNLVTLSLKGKQMVVTISKLGTSTLAFTGAEKNGGLEYVLTEEKIAFTHKPFRDEVVKKFIGLIEQAGGKVVG